MRCVSLRGFEPPARNCSIKCSLYLRTMHSYPR